MPLTKQYLRYSPSGVFNIIASPNCNGSWVTLKNQEGRFVATGACEDIVLWDMNLVEKAAVFSGDKSEVTYLTGSPILKNIAAGFKDGTVKTYDLTTVENVAVFSGHKSAVTCLAYDSNGHRLASGSKDTHIVVWDVVAESGLSRLSEHTGPVTSISFMTDYNILISSSKDTSIRFWDLDTNHCFKTLMGHRTEVWGSVLMRNEEYLVTGCGDSELRVWKLSYKKLSINKDNIDDLDQLNIDKEEENNILSPIQSVKAGSILRSETGKVSTLTRDATGQVLAVHGASGILELFMFSSYLEGLKMMKKRKKKEKKNASEHENGTSISADDEVPRLQDIVKRLPVLKVVGKIKSSSLILGKAGELRVFITLNNNSAEVHSLDLNRKEAQPVCQRKIMQQGHHSEIRAVSFSSDNLAIVTGSGDSVKLWNRHSLNCLRTIATRYVLSICMVPGDRHAIAGLKDGRLMIIDLNTGDILEEIKAHEKEVSSLCVLPDLRGCVSGGGDSSLKFWDFDLIEDKTSGLSAKVLSLLHKRSLQTDEAVLCVRITPNSKLIAVALLDMTVKIFFLDTLKFFLSLYGHKLPVLTMDICYDSTMIVTGSADRNIKIWGLDFGDCHKSIFGHDDSITTVQFVPNTHYFFTCGKDGKVKQWDADNFQKIVTLDGHFGEAWSLAVSPNGEHVISSGADRVLRLFSKTDEPLVLEDEAEEERMREENQQLVTDAESHVKGQSALNLPSRKTVDSELGAEQILECLEVCKSYSIELQEHEALLAAGKKDLAPPALPPIMVAYKAANLDDFVLEVLKRIRSSDLEEALVLLPYPAVCKLIEMFPSLLRRDHQIELIIRTLMFLLRIHFGPVVSNQNLLPILKKVKKLAFNRINKLRDTIGCNLHGLQFLHRNIEQQQGIQLFRDATVQRKENNKRRKRKVEAAKRAILTV